MTALESIIAWAESELPDWQSDAIRRLLVQDALTDDDRRELLLMVKATHGLLPAGEDLPKPQPLRLGEVSGAPETKVNVVLKAVRGLQCVNKIPDGSVLLFGHQGLTAIYGENGSGKSGYSRVLKRACRARDTKERILPNIYGTVATTPAKAVFKLCLNGGPDEEIAWEDGQPGNDALANITVFDSKCARVIVDEKNGTTYLPYGAHVFEELVSVLIGIRQQLEADRPKVLPLQWPDIAPTTAPGAFLARLTRDTKESDVVGAAVWSEKDAERLEKLTKQIAELEANDPIKLATKTRNIKQRVGNLKRYLEQRTAILSDEELAKLKLTFDDMTEAAKAVELASKSALLDEPLAGAGESAWQILFRAAKDYSTKDAYPRDEFPVVGDGSRCVLCMQELSDDAKDRLIRFANFMEQSTKKRAELAKQSFADAVKAVEVLKDQSAKDLHANTLDEIRQRDETVATAVESYLAIMNSRIEYVSRLNAGEAPGELQTLITSPVPSLDQIMEGLELDAKGLESAVDPLERAKLMNDKAEHLARRCFVSNRAKILAHIADLKTAHKFEQAVAATDAVAITRKGKVVVSEALTPQLKAALQLELKELRADHLPLNLKPTGSKGETFHQLELNGAKAGSKASLTDVLSEGEQRVVALAGFLAEIGLGQHSCPIVLDDPVCSLDHRYRANIAARLVLESQRRQVLVFTHDIAFLLALQENAGERSGTHFTAQTIRQQNEATGIPNQGLPWHAMSVKDRLTHLRENRESFKVLYDVEPEAYDKAAAFHYGLLRETWEAAIEEVVLNKTVVRHGCEVQTQRLKRVSVTDDQYKTVDVNMSKCSEWMVGHAKSKALDVRRPPPKDILDDIEALSAFVKECATVGEARRKERERSLMPAMTEVG